MKHEKVKSESKEAGIHLDILVIKRNIKGLNSPVKGSLLYQIKIQNLDFSRKSIIRYREHYQTIKKMQCTRTKYHFQF